MFSPLKEWGAHRGGLRVGIVGIGGLGQMGVQLARAMGNTVTAISTSPNKEAVAKEIGADTFVVSTDPESMRAAAMSCDLILNTVSVSHELGTYLPLLVSWLFLPSIPISQAMRGTIVQLGVAMNAHAVYQMPLMMRKLRVTGSTIGGMLETQECIDFCHRHKIVPRTKLVTADSLLDIYKMLNSKNDSVVRNVLDIEASK